MTDDTIVPLATPTRFLIESGEWNLTPNLGGSIQNEMNPFDCNFQQRTPKDIPIITDKWAHPPVTFTNTNYTSPEPEVLAFDAPSPSTPPMSLSQSPSSSSGFFNLSSPSSVNQPMQPTVITSTQDLHHEYTRRSSRIQTKQTFFSDYIDEEEEEAEKTKPRTTSVQSGRKRRIVFEGDDAEDRRKKFLERNRVAAYKCRQKKKNWMQELEQKAEIQNSRNEELRSTVAQLREESMYLRNLLLSHGNCDCESVQAYLRKSSAEITSKKTIPHHHNHHHNVLSRRASIASHSSYSSVPAASMNHSSMPPYQASFPTIPPFPETSTGLTPFLNTVINKSEPSSDYFSRIHSTTDP